MDIWAPTWRRWIGWSRSRGSTGAQWVLPGHGPACPDPAGLLADYLEHRRERLDLVSGAMAAGTTDPDELLAVVYPEVPRGTPLGRSAVPGRTGGVPHRPGAGAHRAIVLRG